MKVVPFLYRRLSVGYYGPALLFVCAVAAQTIAHAAEPGAAVAAAEVTVDQASAAAREVAGPDMNNNGIRDDLEPFLTENFDSDERVLRSVSNMVMSIQYAIKATTPEESSMAHSMRLRSEECMISLARNLPPYADALMKLDGMVLNTPERVAAFEAHLRRLANMHFVVREAPNWDDGCLKRVDEEYRAHNR